MAWHGSMSNISSVVSDILLDLLRLFIKALECDWALLGLLETLGWGHDSGRHRHLCVICIMAHILWWNAVALSRRNQYELFFWFCIKQQVSRLISTYHMQSQTQKVFQKQNEFKLLLDLIYYFFVWSICCLLGLHHQSLDYQ